MGMLARAVAAERKSVNTSLELFREIYGGRMSSAGKAINLNTAMQVATVFACARLKANGLAQVPLKLFQLSDDEKTSTPARDHPLYWLLYRKPNDFQTSFDYRQTIGLHLALTGNHFSFINRVRGEIRELIPLEPMRVSVEIADDYTLLYKVTAKNGAQQEFPASAIWHIRGPSWGGWLGLDPVSLARDIIGLSIALEESQARFHANGAQPSGLYSVEGKLDKGQYDQLRAWIVKEHASSRNSGVPMILDRSAKWLQQTMTGVDAQHLESRKYQCEELCRQAGVLPIMVGYSDKATTYASSEQMFLAHVIHTMSPIYECVQQSIDTELLTEKEARGGLFAKFLLGSLLRGSMVDTATYIDKLVRAGVMTRNDGRGMIDSNPIDGLDEPLVPTNSTGSQETPAQPSSAGA